MTALKLAVALIILIAIGASAVAETEKVVLLGIVLGTLLTIGWLLKQSIGGGR